MGIAQEQKLVVKHTFLEYECEQQAGDHSPSRQRSQTEPVIDGDVPYGEIRELYHGSDSDSLLSSFGSQAAAWESTGIGGSDSEIVNEAVHVACSYPELADVPATPEVFPMSWPSARHLALPQDEPLWGLPCAESPIEGDCTGWQYSTGAYWAPIPFNANMGFPINYSNAAGHQQRSSQYPATEGWHSAWTGKDVHTEAPHLLQKGCLPDSGIAQFDSGNISKETRTTVMLKGLPETCSRSAVLQLLDTEGFFGRFNFVYLPIDFKKGTNLGYALVNLVSPAEAVRFGKHFEGFSRWTAPCDSICSVAWCSPQQGLQPHLERYRNSPVMHESVPEEWRPLLLAHGVPITFPAPTAHIKAPKLKGIR